MTPWATWREMRCCEPWAPSCPERCARGYGGEELLLILPEAQQNQPILLIERLRRAIAEIPFSYNGSSFRVTASLGVAWVTSPSDTTEDIIARADEALYAAKGAGRDRVEYAATGTSL